MASPASSIENHWGWTFIPFLQGFGGNVFRNPPDDLMPTLDTPEAVEAAEFFAKLINSYGPEAASGYTYDQVTEALRAGRVNYSPHNHAFCALLGEEGSKVINDLELRHGARRVRRAASPASPRTAGAFPSAPRTRTRPGSSSSGRCPRSSSRG